MIENHFQRALQSGSRERMQLLLSVALYLLVNWLLAWLSFGIRPSGEFVVWLPTVGVHLALLWLGGLRYAPLVFLTVFGNGLLITAVPYPDMPPLLLALTFTLVMSGVGWLLRDTLRLRPQLDTLRDVILFEMVVIVAAVAVAALFVLGQLVLVGEVVALAAGLDLALGLMVGMLVMTPLMTVHGYWLLPHNAGWRRPLPKGSIRLISSPQQRMLLLMLGVIVGISWVLARVGYQNGRFVLLMLNLLPLLWIAIISNVRGVVLAMASLTLTLAIISMVQSVSLPVPVTSLFVIIVDVIALMLGAAIAELRTESNQVAFQASMLDSLRESIMVFDRQGNVIFWGRGADRLYGYKTDEIVGENVNLLLMPEDRAEWQQAIDAASLKGVWSGVSKRQAKSGVVFWVDTVLSAMPDDRGAVSAVLAVDRDVTQRWETQKALQQTNEQLEALRRVGLALTAELSLTQLLESVVQQAIQLLDAAAGGIYIYDPERDVLEWTVAFGEHLVAPGYVLRRGEGLSGKVLEQKRPICINDYQSWQGSKPDTYVTYPWQAVVGIPIQWRDEFLGVLDVLHYGERKFSEDDTKLLMMFANQTAVAIQNARLYAQLQSHAQGLEERVAARTQELAAANDQLRILDDLKSKFVSDVSHELRTPVTNLLLYQNLLTRTEDPERHRHYLKVLGLETERLRQLVEGVLTLSRFDAAIETRPYEPIDLNRIVQDVTERLRAAATHVSLELAIEPDLPPVWAFPDQMHQLVTNLVGNAVKYTPAGSVTVMTFVHSEQQQVVLQVADTGIGIEAAEMPFIFDRFYRARQVSQLNQPGTGLGLAIVREIVERHRAELDVQSTPGAGTSIKVSFPLAGFEAE